MSIDLLEPGTRSGGEREPERPLSPTASGTSRGTTTGWRTWSGSHGRLVRAGHIDGRGTSLTRAGVMVAAVLLAVLPLVMDPDGWYVYVQLRWFVLAVSVSALVVLAAVSMRGRRTIASVRGDRGRGVGPRTSPTPPTTLWWGLLLLIAVLAALTSAAPITALSGAQDRMFGASTWILHGGCALAAAVLVRRRRDLVVLARGMTIGLLGVGLVTIAQRGGLDLASGASSFTRPGGPFGNADMLGAYCVLAVLVAVALVLDRDEVDRWRLVAAISATLGLAALVLSGSRASWLATGLGLAVLLTVAARARQVQPLHALATCLAALVLCVGIGVAAGASDRLENLTGGTTEGRVQTWTRAIDTLAERPVLGWGEEGFAQGFTGSVDASFEQDYGRRLTPDRAHNGLLDIATTLGLLGLLAYLGVLVATGRAIMRVLRSDSAGERPTESTADRAAGSLAATTLSDVTSSTDRTGAHSARHRVLPLGIAIALGAYLIQQQALFPLADVDALAWLLAGSLVGLSTTIIRSDRHLLGTALGTAPSSTAPPTARSSTARSSTKAVARRWLQRSIRPALIVVTGIAVIGAVAVGTTQVRADRHARVAADRMAQGDAFASLAAAQAALDLTPGQVLDTLLVADAAIATRDPATIHEAIRTVDRQRGIGFDDGRLTLAQARLLIAAHDLSAPATTNAIIQNQPAPVVTHGDADHLQRAIDLLSELLRRDGARSEAWLLLGDVEQRAGDTSMAIDSWQHAAELRPGSLEPRLRLLDAFVASGNVADAHQVLAQIDRIGEPTSSSGQFELMLLRARLQAAE